MLLVLLKVKVSKVVLNVGTSVLKMLPTVTLYHIVFSVLLVKTKPRVVCLKVKKWQEASKDVLAEVEKELEGKGRVVLRASGTEPVVRVMVEARQADWAKKGAERIAAAITGKQ